MAPTLHAVLATKGSGVVTVAHTATVLEAVRLLCCRAVGSVLVVDGGVPVGILTERDALRRVLAVGRSAAETTVAEAMTDGVVVVDIGMTVLEAMRLMSSRQIRHLPVHQGGVLMGVVSIGDLARCAVRHLDHSLDELTHYIGGPSAHYDSEWPVTFPARQPAEPQPSGPAWDTWSDGMGG